jgi:ankyrin repeat protein
MNVISVSQDDEDLLIEYKSYLSSSDELKGLVTLYNKLHNRVSREELNLLPLAAYYGYFSIVKFYLDNNFDVEGHSIGTPLEIAARAGHASVVELLINRGASVNTKTFPPLFHAVEKNQIYVAKILLQNGADINARPDNNPDKSILFYAKSPEMLQLLLDHGASPDLTMVHQRSLLYFMLKKEKKAMVQMLLEKGANVNLRDDEYNTPLIYYFRRKNRTFNSDAYVPLLDHPDCDIDAQDELGNTALIYAITNGHRDGAFCLIQRGARANLGHESITAISQSVMMYDKELVEEMIKYGADIDDNGAIYLATNFNLDMMQVRKLC